MNEAEIWRTAQELLDRRGLHAHYDAVVRASELNATGDTVGAALWGRVCHAIEELMYMEPPDGQLLQ